MLSAAGLTASRFAPLSHHLRDPFRRLGLIVMYPVHSRHPQNADWGNGCFWHVQHEMIKAEQAILGRCTTRCYTVLRRFSSEKRALNSASAV